MSPEQALRNQVSPLSRFYWPMATPLIHLLSPLTTGEGHRERVHLPPRFLGLCDGMAEPVLAVVAVVHGGRCRGLRCTIP